MITPMRKVFVVARAADRDPLLAALRDLGAVHLAPVDPARAVADAETVARIDRVSRAIQILAEVEARGSAPDLSPAEAAEEVLRIQRESVERAGRLSALHLQLEQLALWGEMRLEDFQALQQAGVRVAFYAVPRKAVDQVQADCVHVLGPWPGRRALVAVAGRGAEIHVPEGSEPVALPPRDRPSIRAEASEIDAALARDGQRLAELAHLVPAMQKALPALRERAAWTLAARGALDDPHLAAIQGWAPADRVDAIARGLASAGLDAAVQSLEPSAEDDPPTLIQYPAWVRPIEGLFKILNIQPGYREMDVSAGFMIALPIFCAMLIGDGGYGLLFLILPALLYRRMAAAMGPQVAQLLMVIGLVTIVWGVMTMSFFGFGPADLRKGQGVWESLGNLLGSLQLLAIDPKSRDSRNMLMQICFIMGAIHLSIAHLWRARFQWPDLRFLNNVGWAVLLWGTFGVVRYFVLRGPVWYDWSTPTPYFLTAGGALVVLFAEPSWNLPKAVALGLAGSVLPAIATLSDTLSYIRLMAVGLAGGVLAASFNQMALNAGILGIPILLFGHGLNLGLCVIALFAHGVRLNVLEFSSNAGMEWSGYAYEPFSRNVEET